MRRRSAFTLVEVLVSMALILFIMSILAAAFGAASQAVSDLKAAGDLAEKLRGATNVLKRDLEADHFTASPQTSAKLSDSNFWDRLNPGNTPIGFFRIFQSQADVPEGTADLDGIPSFSQTTTSLHYTIALNGTRRSDFLSASVPGGSPLTTSQMPPALVSSPNDFLLGQPGQTDQRYQDTPNVYNQQFAEVAVFLAPVADQTDGGVQLFGLYRRQFLTVPPSWGPPTAAQQVPASMAAQYLEVSSVPTAGETSVATNLTFNTMQDLANPVRRFWMQRTALTAQGTFNAVPSPPNPPGTFRYAKMDEVNANFASADLLMTDVLSFDVRVLLKNQSEFVDLFDTGVAAPIIKPFMNNPGFNQTAAGPMVFDTWSNQIDLLTGVDYTSSTTGGTLRSVPLFKSGGASISIQAIQITLRVWDFKTKKTRQVTIVQQM